MGEKKYSTVYDAPEHGAQNSQRLLVDVVDDPLQRRDHLVSVALDVLPRGVHRVLVRARARVQVVARDEVLRRHLGVRGREELNVGVELKGVRWS